MLQGSFWNMKHQPNCWKTSNQPLLNLWLSIGLIPRGIQHEPTSVLGHDKRYHQSNQDTERWVPDFQGSQIGSVRQIEDIIVPIKMLSGNILFIVLLVELLEI
jgi:hypothetical protein